MATAATTSRLVPSANMFPGSFVEPPERKLRQADQAVHKYKPSAVCSQSPTRPLTVGVTMAVIIAPTPRLFSAAANVLTCSFHTLCISRPFLVEQPAAPYFRQSSRVPPATCAISPREPVKHGQFYGRRDAVVSRLFYLTPSRCPLTGSAAPQFGCMPGSSGFSGTSSAYLLDVLSHRQEARTRRSAHMTRPRVLACLSARWTVLTLHRVRSARVSWDGQIRPPRPR